MYFWIRNKSRINSIFFSSMKKGHLHQKGGSFAPNDPPPHPPRYAPADKCHLNVSSDENISVKLENVHVEKSQCEKLLGIQIDSKLGFKVHVSAMCNNTVSRSVFLQISCDFEL